MSLDMNGIRWVALDGKRTDFHVFPLTSLGADFMISDPTAPAYIESG